MRFKPLFHILIWLLVYLLPYFVAFGTGISLSKLFDKGGAVHAFSTLLLVAYAYINYRSLIPKFYLQGRYILYGLIVIAAGLIVMRFPNILQPMGLADMSSGGLGPPHEPPVAPPGNAIWFGLGYNVILFIIVTLGGIGLRQQFQLLEARSQQMDAELSLMKAQINPHFLFNTLNSIYALAIRKSDDTPNAIIQLSELMRYLLKDATTDSVPLSKELSYINSYVLLQQRRLGDTVAIHYEAPVADGSQQIAPLLLMSFIENAFKHGVNPDEAASITIRITVKDHRLQLFVQNNKVSSVSREETIGIGLKNTVSRLQYLYEGRHRLRIEDGSHVFTVDLTMDLA